MQKTLRSNVAYSTESISSSGTSQMDPGLRQGDGKIARVKNDGKLRQQRLQLQS
ncbi:hypothetical protein JYT19_00370 [Sulfobacillus acidophilus]|uniref:Uncharacterized protein n=1 Tax=Sulfobacillus acidophilus TaxID=53633 RepID=A0ABS3AWB7_9FIRM|nr:hypothetical protein [Sulfobacillus acidophilus]